MSKVNIEIEEQLADSRSNEIAYRFSITNNGNIPIQVISIIPRIPEDVRILLVKDPSLQEVSSRQQGVCRDLQNIANAYIEEDLKKSRSWYSRENEIAVTDKQNEKIDILSFLVGVNKIIFEISKFPLKVLLPFAPIEIGDIDNRVPESMKIEINTYNEGLEIYESFIKESEMKENLKNIFVVKLKKLKEYDTALSHHTNNYLAVIEADSFFALTYVLKFKRNIIDTKKYNIHFECCYCDINDTKKLVSGASTNLNISPQPSVLTMIAILGSVLGFTLKVATTTIYSDSHDKFRDEIWNRGISGEPVVCAILSIIFFNIYEYTEFSDKLKLNLNWRYALMIGVLCGLLGEKIIKAFQAFLG